MVNSTSRYVTNAAAKTPITARLHWLLAPSEMKTMPGGQPDIAGGKLSIDSLDSIRSLGENPRKEQTVVKMGHGVGRGTPTPLEWGCASVSARWHGMGNAKPKHETEVMLSFYVHDWKYNKCFKKIPVWTRFSARPDRPWGLPSLL